MTEPTKRLSPQATTVLAYLQAGKGLSNLIALSTLGIGSLSSRIAELKAIGHDITAESRTQPNGKRYTVYHMKETT